MSPKRNDGLDFIRGLSVLLVLIQHWRSDGEGYPAWLKIVIAGLGNYAVHLFFVLSGYLVAGILFREYAKTGTVHPGRFLLRRGVRIYPLYYLCLALTVLLYLTLYRYLRRERPDVVLGERRGGTDLTWERVLFDAFFLPGPPGTRFQTTQAHFWTLKIEEHFYLFTALVLWLCLRPNAAHLLWILAAFALVPLAQMALRGALYQGTVAAMWGHGYGTLSFGVFLALAQHVAPASFERIARDYRWWIALPSFVAYFAHRYVPRTLPDTVPAPLRILNVMATPFVQSVLAMAVVYGFYGFATLPRFWRPLLWLGFYSYAVYLFHMHICQLFEWLRVSVPSSVGAEIGIFLAYVAASILVGYLTGAANQWLGDRVLLPRLGV